MQTFKQFSEAYKHKNPAMKNIRVEPEFIDEWFGIVVRFNWKQKDFWDKWNKQSDDEVKLVELLAAEAAKSKEWKMFYKKAAKINWTTDTSSIDTSPRNVTIPQFKPRDFTDWEFDQSGGWFSATDR